MSARNWWRARERTDDMCIARKVHCSDLAEVIVKSGHWMAQEQRVALNVALTKWSAAKFPDYWTA